MENWSTIKSGINSDIKQQLRRIDYHPAKKTDSKQILKASSISTSDVKINKQISLNNDYIGLFDPKIVLEYLSWKSVNHVGPGFFNDGNSCYLNSTLQCLMHTPSLVQIMQFQQAIALKGIKNNADSRSRSIIQHFSTLIHEIWSANSSKTISPRCMVSTIRRVGKQFKPMRQEDAHEYLIKLLDTMHEEVLKANNIKISDGKIAETSVISRIFGGSFCNTLTCTKCGYNSKTFNHFQDLSLELPGKVNSVSDAIGMFTKAEFLSNGNEWRCDKCNVKVKAKKQMTLHQLPNVLVLHLKRFASQGFSSFGGGKIAKHIQFELKMKLSSSDASKNEKNVVYDLFAFVVHHGSSTHSGHYIAYVKASNGQWYEMNDSKVSLVQINQVLRQQAYILFYNKTISQEQQQQQKPTINDMNNNNTTIYKNANENVINLKQQVEAKQQIVDNDLNISINKSNNKNNMSNKNKQHVSKTLQIVDALKNTDNNNDNKKIIKNEVLNANFNDNNDNIEENSIQLENIEKQIQIQKHEQKMARDHLFDIGEAVKQTIKVETNKLKTKEPTSPHENSFYDDSIHKTTKNVKTNKQNIKINVGETTVKNTKTNNGLVTSNDFVNNHNNNRTATSIINENSDIHTKNDDTHPIYIDKNNKQIIKEKNILEVCELKNETEYVLQTNFEQTKNKEDSIQLKNEKFVRLINRGEKFHLPFRFQGKLNILKRWNIGKTRKLYNFASASTPKLCTKDKETDQNNVEKSYEHKKINHETKELNKRGDKHDNDVSNQLINNYNNNNTTNVENDENNKMHKRIENGTEEEKDLKKLKTTIINNNKASMNEKQVDVNIDSTNFAVFCESKENKENNIEKNSNTNNNNDFISNKQCENTTTTIDLYNKNQIQSSFQTKSSYEIQKQILVLSNRGKEIGGEGLWDTITDEKKIELIKQIGKKQIRDDEKKRKGKQTDIWNEKLDEGRIKKIKKVKDTDFNSFKSNENLFQNVQNQRDSLKNEKK